MMVLERTFISDPGTASPCSLRSPRRENLLNQWSSTWKMVLKRLLISDTGAFVCRSERQNTWLETEWSCTLKMVFKSPLSVTLGETLHVRCSCLQEDRALRVGVLALLRTNLRELPLWEGMIILKGLILSIFGLGGCGDLERTDYLLGTRESYGPKVQHSQDCLIFFIWLNYVRKLKNKVLPPYVKLPCHKVAPGIPLPLSLITFPALLCVRS